MGKLKAASDYSALPINSARSSSPAAPAVAAPGITPANVVQSRFDAAEVAISQSDTSKPSPHDASVRSKLRDKKVFGLGKLPAFTVDEFERLRLEAGMGKREFFYHLLRSQGADIPSYEQLDGRWL